MSDLIDDVPEAFRGFNRYDSQIALPSKEINPEGYNPAQATFAALNNLIWVIRAAALGAESAHSWRDYHVGSAALAYDFELPALGIVVGGNFKDKQGKDGLNLHAEQVALAKARDRGLDYVVGLAVWGDPTDSDANPSQAPTLRPCRRCDGMFQEAPEVKPETLILSGNDDFSVCELYTAQELHTYYQNPDASGPISEVPPYSLSDGMSDDEYIMDVFVPYLIPKVTGMFRDRG